MRFLVISGRSGSGKSSALHLLEDEGFTCIDNLPVNLLPALMKQISSLPNASKQKFAVGIDARNIDGDLSKLPEMIAATPLPKNTNCEIVYLDTSREILLQRFSETRRRHPLSDKQTSLNEAIAKEKAILAPIAAAADITIDTSHLNLHELRSTVKSLVVGEETKGIAITFKSFGFKHGIPVDADFIYDVRCLPNPYWSPALRSKSGLDKDVVDFLDGEEEVEDMYNDILSFIMKWIPRFEKNNRSYLTIAIGCTGGLHRSVYLCERLANKIRENFSNVQTRHRQLAGNSLDSF